MLQEELLHYFLEFDLSLKTNQKLVRNPQFCKLKDYFTKVYQSIINNNIPEDDEKRKKKLQQIRVLLKALIHQIDNSKTD